jgi:hypothetical protein
VNPLTVRQVRDAPSTAAKSVTMTTIAELSAWVVIASDGAPLVGPAFAEAPNPVDPENRSALKPQTTVAEVIVSLSVHPAPPVLSGAVHAHAPAVDAPVTAWARV